MGGGRHHQARVERAETRATAGGHARTDQARLQIGSEGKTVVFDLKPGDKGKDGNFAFDRFGLLTMRKGGGKPHAIYFDTLTYTVAPQ